MEAKSVLKATALDFSQWFQIKAQPFLRRLDWDLIRKICLILAISFVSASTLSTITANFALNSVARSFKENPRQQAIMENVDMESSRSEIPQGTIKKMILERNIFNAEGKLAVEEEGERISRTKDLDFSGVPCTEAQLPVEVVGTVFTGDPARSFVTIKDSKVPDADIYKAGDLIIDHEDYEVFRVYRGKVEFRKGDEKICKVLDGIGNKDNPLAQGGAGKPSTFAQTPLETLEFDSAYVSSQIGPGYANILNSAKLIPTVNDGKSVGFKVLSIQPGTLFDKIFKDGDIVAEVNGVSLQDPSQGFKLYEALQEEREITIGVIRDGQPMTRKVRVK